MNSVIYRLRGNTGIWWAPARDTKYPANAWVQASPTHLKLCQWDCQQTSKFLAMPPVHSTYILGSLLKPPSDKIRHQTVAIKVTQLKRGLRNEKTNHTYEVNERLVYSFYFLEQYWTVEMCDPCVPLKFSSHIIKKQANLL